MATPSDAIVHPEIRRKGIFTQLTLHSIEELENRFDYFISTSSNEQSTPGNIKLGWYNLKTKIYTKKICLHPLQYFLRYHILNKTIKHKIVNESNILKKKLHSIPSYGTECFIKVYNNPNLEEMKCLNKPFHNHILYQYYPIDYFKWRFISSPYQYLYITLESAQSTKALLIIKLQATPIIMEYFDVSPNYSNITKIINNINKVLDIKKLIMLDNKDVLKAFFKKSGFGKYDWLKSMNKKENNNISSFCYIRAVKKIDSINNYHINDCSILDPTLWIINSSSIDAFSI